MAYIIGTLDVSNGFSSSLAYASNLVEKQIDYKSILEYMSFEAASEAEEKYIEPFLDINDY